MNFVKFYKLIKIHTNFKNFAKFKKHKKFQASKLFCVLRCFFTHEYFNVSKLVSFQETMKTIVDTGNEL